MAIALRLDKIIVNVNTAGSHHSLSPDERFVFYSLAGRTERGLLLVKVLNKKTKTIKTTQYGHLVYAGHNPFNQTQDRHEENVIQPKIKSFLRKQGLLVEEEVYISRRSRVDFLCTNKKGKKIIIEVKSHKKRHTGKDLTSQIKKYNIDGKRKFKNKFSEAFLVSMNGRYGYSLNDLKLVLKQKGLI